MLKDRPIRSREEICRIITDFAAPHINLVYNPNLQQEAQIRAKVKRDAKYAHNGACQDSDPVMTEQHDRMIFGSYIRPDGRTLEYDDKSRLHFLIHEIGHMVCKRKIWDYEKYSPDLYGWTLEIKNGGAPWAAMEEMATGFIGFIWLAKLDIIFDCIYYDMTDEATSKSLNFPNKAIDMTPVLHLLSETFRKKIAQDGNKVWMACDADLSPIYRVKALQGDLNTTVLANSVFGSFGTKFYELMGICDEKANIVGTINSEIIQHNRGEIQKLFKVLPQDLDDFINYLCL